MTIATGPSPWRVLALLLSTLVPLATSATEVPTSLFTLTAETLDGKPQPLAAYEGKVVLVVNTASECGFTPQYAGLQALQEKYASRGFTVLGIPSNDFGGQEPGTAAQIAEFTTSKYHVTFPLLAKAATRGDAQSPIYAFLTRGHGEPRWNFHKYLVGRDGAVRGEFSSRVTPESDELRTAIEAALAE